MKSALKLVVGLVAFTAISAQAEGQGGEEFTQNIARLSGTLQCTMTKADGGMFDCAIRVKGQGQVAIIMKPMKNKAGEIQGYGGMERSQVGTMFHTIAIGTDANKAVKGVSLITDNMDGSSNAFNATIAASATNVVKAMNISPIGITMPDQNSMTVDLSFVVYGTHEDKVATGLDSKGLSDQLLDQVRPYLMSIQR